VGRNIGFLTLTANPPPTVVTGELAMTPEKKRVIIMVCRFIAVAVAVAADRQMKVAVGKSADIRLRSSIHFR
jgi:hypothetical protein